ncbi:hypothetical protein VTH8203_03504 [Vibrio thalassae]|uniref:Uncharacterized protein n=1 Tax=Vibrio thalassae TaxID=1243014 RepID=A0A240EML9_9VIBR|nr:hypothetical protein [Vibrio thalassae]SNX49856.1 hypothetical protein VTH8203_03504 [Vibrio thalassae]
MGQLIVKVIVPAQMHTGMMMVPDPMPQYIGTQSQLLNGTLPPVIAGATVIGGKKLGNKWMGCTYMKAPYVIPGFAEAEEIPS